MADNYLERRMEDLRNGRLRPSSNFTSTGSRKGSLHIPFPSRRVLVTGGVNGIGLAIARAFLKAGCKVAVFDCDEEKGRKLSTNEGIRFYNINLADVNATERAMDDLLKAWRDLDIVVSNAGISKFKKLIESTPADFQDILDINLRPAYVITRKLAVHRNSLPYPNPFGGRVILISSTRHIQSEAGTEAYSASKGALASLTHALMMSLSEFHITVNSISPGWINTLEAELSEADKIQHPSHRVGTPDDIARLCLFLSAPDNDFINGADIPVDGGMTRKMIYLE
ncbi:MAG: SDR family oxidoreductase [Muribaculaceae bacterium]|nr:SDR family oxidoreductase [Muribaculaceae bacterium]